MRIALRCCCSIAIFAFAALLADSTYAYLPGYRTRTVPSANGRFLLVLIAPKFPWDAKEDDSSSERLTPEEASARQRGREIEQRYPRSGLYHNDGSTDILWPIDYISVSKEILVADDGVHLVVTYLDWDVPWPSDRGDALTFYARGQELATYLEDNLLVGFYGRLLLANLCNSGWPICTDSRFDEQAKTFEITTNWGDMFRFDITTGALVATRLAWPIKAAFLSAATLITLAGWWLWRRVRRARNFTQSVGVNL